MPRMSFAAALVDALYIAMAEDPSVSIIGSYPLGLGPQRSLMDRVRERFADRIVDPPIAEAGVAGLGAGAAMAGARPFVDLGTASFSYLAWSQLVNEAAVAHYMSDGRITVPVVYHMLHGVRGGGAPQHSQSPQAMLWNAPGLEIVAPSTPADVKGLLLTAIRSNNPTVVVNHAKLMGIEGEVPAGDAAIPFGRADIKRPGRDVTVVATSFMVQETLKAAEALARDGIEIEVVDPRTQVPFDQATILESVGRTGRLVVVDECPLRGGVASEIAATVAEHGFRSLKAPIVRVARADTPVPFSAPLEAAVTPDPAKIADAVRRVMAA
jgi:pyruvate/2-oxoglutarate/acetoin dehydrogenase E1 component